MRVESSTPGCVPPLCEAWNDVAEMPNRFVGRKVRVTLTKGLQIIGEAPETISVASVGPIRCNENPLYEAVPSKPFG
jgi:hypothetical protein